MANDVNKIKLLLLWDILCKHTDENHAINTINGDVIISTIQKLFAVLTGQTIADDEDEDKEDELNFNRDNDKNAPAIELGNDLKLPPDYFQFIIVDECHRSVHG